MILLRNASHFGIAPHEVFIAQGVTSNQDGIITFEVFKCEGINLRETIRRNMDGPILLNNLTDVDALNEHHGQLILHGVHRSTSMILEMYPIMQNATDIVPESVDINTKEVVRYEMNGEFRPIEDYRRSPEYVVGARSYTPEEVRSIREGARAREQILRMAGVPSEFLGMLPEEKEAKERLDAEEKAKQTLRELLGDKEYKRYLANDFVTVFGESGRLYKIYKGDRMTEVYDETGKLGSVCVVIPDKDIPPTDSIIARIVMIQEDERGFYDKGNVIGGLKKPRKSLFSRSV